MTEARKRSILATMLFVGSMLGAGIFGLPYAFAQSGWFIGFVWLVVIGGFLFILQLMNAELTIQTPGHSRLAGIAGRYLGPAGRYITTILFFGLGWGVLIAYIILGGGFLNAMFGEALGGSAYIYSLIFIGVEAFLVSLSLKRAAHFELIIGGILLVLFVVLILSGVPFINFDNLTSVYSANTFLPYGVVLFAISGLGLAPEVHAIFGEKYEYRMPKAVIHGFAIVFALYVLFTIAVVGVNGILTTENALDGYTAILGPGMGVFGALIGVITIGSIFMMMGEQMKDTFIYDFSMNKHLAWFITLIVPVTLFVLGVRDFISVISFTGAVFTALLACMVILSYESMRKKICKKVKCFTVPRWISISIAIIFIIGAVCEIILSFFL